MKNEAKTAFFSRVFSIICTQERLYNNTGILENKGDL
jgi:hypothetical protein